jgi:hypothetical protein
MDPIGFGLENFGPLGRWRDSVDGLPVESTGTLPDGASFSGPRELSELLARKPEFASCVVEKLLVYALGRSVRSDELEWVEKVADDGGFRAVIVAIVSSPAFRNRRESTGRQP